MVPGGTVLSVDFPFQSVQRLGRMAEVAGLEMLQAELEADVAADSMCWADTVPSFEPC